MTDRVVSGSPSNAPVLASQLDHNQLQNLTVGDVHTQYAFLGGRVGGQQLIGGTAAGNELELIGSSEATLGLLRMGSPIEIDYNRTATAVAALRWQPTYEVTALLSDIFINFTPEVTISSAVYLAFVIQGNGTFTQSVAPFLVFSNFIFFNAQPILQSDDAAFATLNPLVFRAAVTLKNDGLGGATQPTGELVGMDFQPIVQAVNAGDLMTVTNQTALRVQPKWNTLNATATADLGTIRGVHCQDIAQAPFGGSSGSEVYENYIGLDYEAMVARIAGTSNVCVRSMLPAFLNHYFLQNVGGAQSDFGGGTMENLGQTHITVDNVGLTLGASDDVAFLWNGIRNTLQWDPVVGSTIEWNFGSVANVLTLARFPSNVGFRLDFDRMSFGTVAPNPSTTSFWIDVTPAARSAQTTLWRDVNMALGATNVSLNGNNLTEFDGLRVQAPAATLGGNTITDASTLHLESMETQGTRNQGLWIEDARARVDGILNFTETSPSQITGDQNNYAIPTTSSGRMVHRLSTDALRTITGIVIEQTADAIWIINVGSFDLILAHQNVASTATNRMISPTGLNLTLGPDEAAQLWHDPVTNRWRILYTTGA